MGGAELEPARFMMRCFGIWQVTLLELSVISVHSIGMKAISKSSFADR